MKAKRTLVFVENTVIPCYNPGNRKFLTKYKCSECGKIKYTYSKKILCECQIPIPSNKDEEELVPKKNKHNEKKEKQVDIVGRLFWKEHITDTKELVKRTGLSAHTILALITEYYNKHLKPKTDENS